MESFKGSEWRWWEEVGGVGWSGVEEGGWRGVEGETFLRVEKVKAVE